MKDRILQSLTLGLLTLAMLAVSACSGDPSPSYQEARNIETTHMAVTKMGEPLELEGYQEQVHRVALTSSPP